jgi:uncharacterized membrane protein YfcA
MKFKKVLIGAAIGFLNGFFGAFGGVAAVLALEKMGEDPKKAHAMAVGIILPIAFISAVYYYIRRYVDFSLLLKTVPFGVVGSFLGCFFLKRLSGRWVKGLFSILMIYSAIVLILR